jgi:hypothetical protein
MDSFHLRIRIDRAIAEKTIKKAHARGMELPDYVRMLLTKDAGIDDSSNDEEHLGHHAAEPSRPYFAYDGRQWNSMKAVLDGELALALVNQYIASHSLQIEALTDQEMPDPVLLEGLKQQRNEARQILATLDPSDADTIRAILARFGPPPEPEEPDAEERSE